MAGKAIAQMQLAGMVADDGEQKVQLKVGAIHRGVAFEEGSSFRERRGHHARAVFLPAGNFAHHAHAGTWANAKVVGVFAFKGVNKVQMVLQVLPNTGQGVHHLNAVVGDVFGAAHTRQLQQLWRAKSPRGHNHFALSSGNMLLAAEVISQARGALAFKQNFGRPAVGDDREVGPLAHDGVQISCSSRAALTIACAVVKLGDLVKACTLVIAGVEVFAQWNALMLSGLNEGVADGARRFLIRDM